MRFTRAASVGVVAVLSIVIFGSMSAAVAAPAAPFITLPASGFITTTPTISVSGTADLASTVTLNLDGTPLAACTDLVVVDNAGTGEWGCEAPIPMGSGTFTATSTDGSGTSGLSNAVSGNRVGGDVVLIDQPADSYDTTPTFTGTGPAYGSVDVYLLAEGDVYLCTAVVAADSSWSCESEVPVPYGYNTVRADATPFANAAPPSSAMTGAFNVILDPPALDYVFGPASVTITATGDPQSTVRVEVYQVTDSNEGYQFGYPVEGCPYLADEEFNNGASPQTCSYPGLAPGIWAFVGQQLLNGYGSEYREDFVLIPTAPTLSAHVNAQRKVVLSGTGVAGDVVLAQTTAGAGVCQAVVASNLTWSCTITAGAGARSYRAVQQSQGFVADLDGFAYAQSSYNGTSAYSNSDSVTVPAAVVPAAAPTAEPTPTPTTTPAPVNWTLKILGDDDGQLTPDEVLTLTGSDLPPGSGVVAELHSTPIELGTTSVGEDGTFSLVVTIPSDAPPGDHNIVVVVTPPPGSDYTAGEATAPVTVVAPASTGSTPAGAPTIPRQQPGAASALSVGFTTPADIISNPLVAATAGSLGLALVLLVLVPAEFFGESLANQYSAFATFFSRRKRLSRAASAVGTWVGAHRLISGIVLVLLTSAVFCFVDPGFGFDLTSLRLLLSCAISILIVNFVSAGITELVAERAWGVPTRLKVMPWGLAIAIVGVVASRILSFSPGFLIGSIIGVSIVGHVAAKLETKVILLWSTVVWALSVAAWALIGVVPVLPASHPTAFWTALLTDSLVSTSAAGLTALLVALLPIALFDGGELFGHSKLIWAIAFGISAATFCVIVVPSAGNWMGLGDGLLGWLLLTLCFIVLAIVTYVFARRRSNTQRSRLMSAQ
jgi:hypothetical protein